jgi:hypothetical protein
LLSPLQNQPNPAIDLRRARYPAFVEGLPELVTAGKLSSYQTILALEVVKILLGYPPDYEIGKIDQLEMSN